MTILLVGGAGAGKDTVAQILQTKYAYHPIALATPIKTFVDGLLGPGKHRTVYQRIGDVMRDADPHVFIRAVLTHLLAHPTERAVVTDVRYPNELRQLQEHLASVQAWFITAPLSVRLDRLQQRDGFADPGALTHSSEQVESLRGLCHAEIDNSGDLPALRQQIQYLLQSIPVS
jgi:dephospho-CoA kinase